MTSAFVNQEEGVECSTDGSCRTKTNIAVIKITCFGGWEGSVVRSAARRDAISPGSRVGLRSTCSMRIVGRDALVSAL